MDEQNRNLLLAFVLSLMVLIVWMWMFPPPEPQPQTEDAATAEMPLAGDDVAPGTALDAPTDAEVTELPRVPIDTPRLEGSINLLGGRLDDLSLRDYRETTDPGADIVEFLRPETRDEAFYALYGWRPGRDLDWDAVPGATTPWDLVEGDTLSPGRPVTLRWDNGQGLTFMRRFAIDENYMFSVTQSVENTGDATARLAPYGLIARHGEPSDAENFFILHEGILKVTDGTLSEDSYRNARNYRVSDREGTQASVIEVAENGWLGFTDKYWMAALIPQPGQPFTAVSRYVPSRELYQTRADLPVVVVGPGERDEITTMLFAGAKEWTTIRTYEREGGIDRFIDAIDWGWFFFLTKPIFATLYFINGIIGNMGWSIIMLTLLIKAVLLPLAWKSYVSMAKMKELQPEMMAIKERAGDDRQKLQQEMMKLYKEKKVNPAAGCLPILMQIPIFFSLYKVIFVTIELRHAPWFGVFNDLSAPDPTSIFNFFGLLPWAAPHPESFLSLIFIGILPIFLGVSMWFQMRLNPAPTDPIQQAVFNWMPWIFMFMLGWFASGLVLYWIANNVITFSQQYTIMRMNGHKPDLVGNILGAFKRSKPDKPAEAKGGKGK
ncbi:membrane protein insertase YidC [Rhodobacteraceae bacterium 2376]|uniref:Membrane protein insertase YidC n=1 Tax=Rhabdonatronobacter sediminivivens TaxID=2743469 RepID=A0A7Z0HYB7_9RHOB|nr:membrane protein insertase YidC [Rhabdonatronobacter sediminivivens]NYS24523.1 membrane protein insertase YidC [Rhabdonatronobacter sediminivivens]